MQRMNHAQKINSLSEQFARAAKRTLITLFASAAMLVSGQVFGQTQNEQTDNTPMAGIPLVDTPAHTPSIDTVATINKALRDSAQKNFIQLTALVKTDYSDYLKTFEEYLNKKLEKDTTLFNRVVVMDPADIDVGLALGLSAEQTVRAIFKDKSVQATDEVVEQVANSLSAWRVVNIAKDESFTQNPSVAAPLMEPHAETCVLTPPSDYIVIKPFKISGLRIEEATIFTNLHEGFHVQDSRLSYRGLDPELVQATLNKGTDAMLAEPQALQYICTKYNKESFADLGAIGYMIHRGKWDTDLIDVVDVWRSGHPDDFFHLSSPVLEEFKKRIDVIGLETFRALDEDSLRNFYYGIVTDEGMTPARLSHMLKYSRLDSLDQEDYLQKNITDADFIWALKFVKASVVPETAAAPAPEKKPKISHEQKRAGKKVSKWDAEDILKKTAVESSGYITPQSLIDAYGRTQRALESKAQQNPKDAPLCRQQRIKLKSVFIKMMTEGDFVAMNKEYGISLKLEENNTVKQIPANDRHPKKIGWVLSRR